MNRQSSWPWLLSRRCWQLALCVLALVSGVLADIRPASAQAMRAPSNRYFLYLQDYYDGSYQAALANLQGEAQSGVIKSFQGNWIDSICVYAMIGECSYQLGEHNNALAAFTTALNVYLQHADWMVNARFTPIRGLQPGQLINAPWGPSRRQRQLGTYDETFLMAMGQLNQQQALLRGGVVQNPTLFPLNVAEVVRCTALALKRRTELLGPLSPHDALNAQVLTTLSRRPGQPNHWSECWISLQLGMAYVANGKDAQAKQELERAVLAGGQFDHPLTSMALLELGRIAVTNNDYDGALNLLLEASLSAVQYPNPQVLEEAFRLGFTIHMATQRQGIFPPLLLATQWAQRNSFLHLLTSLHIMTAENAIVLGENKIAQQSLDQARIRMTGSGMPAGKIGARYQYLVAQSNYKDGQVANGDKAFERAMTFQRGGSMWLWHITLVDNWSKTQLITPRVAMDTYTTLLRDPTAADWSVDPLETMGKLVWPHGISYENWFEVAIERQEYERAVEIADMARRHRFLSALEFGGRLLNLRWVLESPLESLDRTTQLQRQEILTRYPQYAKASETVRKLREQLKDAPLAPSEQPAQRALIAKCDEMAVASAAQEVVLREIATRREACNLVFPPLHSIKDVQKSLPSGHALWAFFNTSKQLHAFLMTNDKYGYWGVPPLAQLHKSLDPMLRGLGNWDQNKQLKLDDLRDDKWKKPAQELFTALWSGSKADIKQFQELIIIPDNVIWYVPFESLLVAGSDTPAPLLSRVRLRYAPTVGLALSDSRPRNVKGNMVAMLGRLYPQDDDDVARQAFDEIARSIKGAIAVQGHLLPGANVYTTLMDRLMVLGEVQPSETDLFGVQLFPLDKAAPSSSLGSWLRLPWGGPQEIFLPGFHTPAEGALKKAGDGSELFVTTCGLMATGARTILISRWRPGGHSSYELVREFAQELPHSTASASWQRAVKLTSATPIDVSAEPRILPTGIDVPPLANHPFFWSSFMVIDTGSEPPKDDAANADGVIKVK